MSFRALGTVCSFRCFLSGLVSHLGGLSSRGYRSLGIWHLALWLGCLDLDYGIYSGGIGGGFGVCVLPSIGLRRGVTPAISALSYAVIYSFHDIRPICKDWRHSGNARAFVMCICTNGVTHHNNVSGPSLFVTLAIDVPVVNPPHCQHWHSVSPRVFGTEPTEDTAYSLPRPSF